MKHFIKMVFAILLLTGIASTSGFASHHKKRPKDTNTSGVNVHLASTCDILNTILKAPAAPPAPEDPCPPADMAPNSVVFIEADLPHCDVRVEIPGVVITADPTLPTDLGGKPEGFARLHSVTLSSAEIDCENDTTVFTASDTTLRNLWFDSHGDLFFVTQPCETGPANCTEDVMVPVNEVDAVVVNGDPVVNDFSGNPVRDVSNGRASHPSRRVTLENSFAFAGRNGVVALKALNLGQNGATQLTVQTTDIHVSDDNGDGKNRVGILISGARNAWIQRNLIQGDGGLEAIGIITDDLTTGGGLNLGITVDRNIFRDLHAVGEFNNHRSGSFSRNNIVNTNHGLTLVDRNGVVNSILACENQDPDPLVGDSALWLFGHNKFEILLGDAIQVQDGCGHSFGNNGIQAANIGIALVGTASFNGIAGNNLAGTLVGVFLDADTEFNDIIGRSGDHFEQDSGNGTSTNTITGNRLDELPLLFNLALQDWNPDHS